MDPGGGSWWGARTYIAPGQVKGEQVDGTCGHLLARLRPVRGPDRPDPVPRDTEMAKYYAHVSDPPPSMLELVPDIELGLDEVVQRAVAKDPAERFQAAGEMAAAALDAAGVPRRDTDGGYPRAVAGGTRVAPPPNTTGSGGAPPGPETAASGGAAPPTGAAERGAAPTAGPGSGSEAPPTRLPGAPGAAA